MFFCAHCAMSVGCGNRRNQFLHLKSRICFSLQLQFPVLFFFLFFVINNSELFFLRFCWFSYFAVALNAYFHMLLSNFTDGFCYSRLLPQLAIGCVYSGLCSVLCVLGDLGTGSPIRMRTYSRFGFPRELCKYVFVWLADFC